MKRIYVSLPISGLDYNAQKRHAMTVAQYLRDRGYFAITPFDINPTPTISYNAAMGRCVEILLECDVIYLCKGWESSKGCNAELQVALVYKKEIMVENQD